MDHDLSPRFEGMGAAEALPTAPGSNQTCDVLLNVRHVPAGTIPDGEFGGDLSV
jgi:hypothetical protein